MRGNAGPFPMVGNVPQCDVRSNRQRTGDAPDRPNEVWLPMPGVFLPVHRFFIVFSAGQLQAQLPLLNVISQQQRMDAPHTCDNWQPSSANTAS
jgi:hypothetical protein